MRRYVARFADKKAPLGPCLSILLTCLLTWSASLLAQTTPEPFRPEGGGEAVKTDIRPPDVIHWRVFDATAYQDGTVLVGVTLATEQGFTLYEGEVRFTSPSGYELTRIRKPPTESLVDPISGKEVAVFRGGDFFLLFSGLEPYTARQFPLAIAYLGCTSRICLFPYTAKHEVPSFLTKEVRASKVFAEVEPSRPDEAATAVSAAPERAHPTGAQSDGAKLGLEDRLARQVKEGLLSFWMLLVVVFLGGLLTNLTPCVYPMIPITVRLLAHQGRSPLAGALAYAGGIVVTYTLLGVFAALSGSMFGQMMASPWFNAGFAAVMIVLGLGMLGFGNLGFLQNLGNKVGLSQLGLKNAFLMGTGAGLVASPCTGPILAALLAYTAIDSDVLRSSVLLFVYSLGFALPYVFLGGAAARMAAIHVSAKVQVVIKVAFAALMFGLGLYYLRVPAYMLLKSIAPYWSYIAAVGGLLGGLLLVPVLSIPAWQLRKGILLGPSLLLGLAVFASSQWLILRASSPSREQLSWYHSEAEALADAEKRGAPLLIDMWAEWCEACKKMDATTFSDPEVIAALSEGGWVLLKLDLTESTPDNDKIQEKYGVHGLPTLVIKPAGGGQAVTLAGYVSAELLREQLAR